MDILIFFAVVWILSPLALIPALLSKRKQAKRNTEYYKFVEFLWDNGRISENEYTIVTGHRPLMRPRFPINIGPPPEPYEPEEEPAEEPVNNENFNTVPKQPVDLPAPEPFRNNTAAAMQSRPPQPEAPAAAFHQETPLGGFTPLNTAQPEKSNILTNGKLLLTIGTFLIVIAGFIFSGAKWASLSGGERVGLLFISALFFLGASWLFGRKLELFSTGVAYFSIGSLFSTITFLTAGNYHMLGREFSPDGAADWSFSGAALLLTALFAFLGYKAYKSTPLQYGCISLIITGASMFVFQCESYGVSMLICNALTAALLYAVKARKFKAPENWELPVRSMAHVARGAYVLGAIPLYFMDLNVLDIWTTAILLLCSAELLFYSWRRSSPAAKFFRSCFAVTSLALIVKFTAFNYLLSRDSYLVTLDLHDINRRLCIFICLSAAAAVAFSFVRRIRSALSDWLFIFAALVELTALKIRFLDGKLTQWYDTFFGAAALIAVFTAALLLYRRRDGKFSAHAFVFPICALYAASLVSDTVDCLAGKIILSPSFAVTSLLLSFFIAVYSHFYKGEKRDVMLTASLLAGSSAAQLIALANANTLSEYLLILTVSLTSAVIFECARPGASSAVPLILAFITSLFIYGDYGSYHILITPLLTFWAISLGVSVKMMTDSMRKHYSGYKPLIPASALWTVFVVTVCTGLGRDLTACVYMSFMALGALFPPVSKKIAGRFLHDKPTDTALAVSVCLAAASALSYISSTLIICLFLAAALGVFFLYSNSGKRFLAAVPLLAAFRASFRLLPSEPSETTIFAAILWIATLTAVGVVMLSEMKTSKKNRYSLMLPPSLLWTASVIYAAFSGSEPVESGPEIIAVISILFTAAYFLLRKLSSERPGLAITGYSFFASAVYIAGAAAHMSEQTSQMLLVFAAAAAAIAAAETLEYSLFGAVPMGIAVYALINAFDDSTGRCFAILTAFAAVELFSRFRRKKTILDTNYDLRTIDYTPLFACWTIYEILVQNSFASFDMRIFIAELMGAVSMLNLCRRETPDIRKLTTFSLASILTAFALITRPFAVPDSGYWANNINAALMLGLGFLLYFIWHNHDINKAELMKFAGEAVAFVMIVLRAYTHQETPEFITALTLSLAVLVYSFRVKSGRWFIISGIATVFITLYSTRETLVRIEWWIYLLTAGLILVSIAAANEYSKKKEKQLKDHVKDYISSWKL